MNYYTFCLDMGNVCLLLMNSTASRCIVDDDPVTETEEDNQESTDKEDGDDEDCIEVIRQEKLFKTVF